MPLYHLSELENFCRQQMSVFKNRQVVLLEGDLGSGKTTLIKKCIELLGGGDAESPTFSVINEYMTTPKVFHVDLYRLEDSLDIESTGFWDLFDEESAYIFIEWSNRISDSDWPRSWSPIKWTLKTLEKSYQREIKVTTLL